MRNPSPVSSTLCAALAVAVLMAGCATDCDEAKDKLEHCHDEIYDTAGATTVHPVPITFNDDCSGENRCVAECVNATSCEALAFVLNHVSDPNRSIPAGTEEFSRCYAKCTGFAP